MLGTSTDEQYRDRIEELYTNATWVEMVEQLTCVVVHYFQVLPRLPWLPSVPDESAKDVAHFSILALEVHICITSQY